jgi:5'-phosphate synthase pdxT subunit
LVGRGFAKRVGVLAIQGDVEAHAKALVHVGAEAIPVRRPGDLKDLDALVLPGGESTTIALGLERQGLYEPLRRFLAAGRPALGTCAGAILLASKVEDDSVPTLGAIQMTVRRNAYGTQVDSFAAPVDPGGDPSLEGLRCVFIRAPRFLALGKGVDVLARVGGEPVLVRQSACLAASFHPELTDDPRVHQLLLEGIRVC